MNSDLIYYVSQQSAENNLQNLHLLCVSMEYVIHGASWEETVEEWF